MAFPAPPEATVPRSLPAKAARSWPFRAREYGKPPSPGRYGAKDGAIIRLNRGRPTLLVAVCTVPGTIAILTLVSVTMTAYATLVTRTRPL